MTPITIFYHADCLDGFGAAYAAWRKFGSTARYRPMHHGMPWLPADVEHAAVYVLDFSFAPEVLDVMASLASSVVQLDHHASARDAWLAHFVDGDGSTRQRYHDPERHLDVIFDMDQSGARMAWEHFHPGTQVPRALQYIEDQDLWRFALPESRNFCAALRLRAFDFDIWDDIVPAAEQDADPRYQQHLIEGRAIASFHRVEVERLADSRLVTPFALPGPAGETVSGLAINASALFASELGNTLAERSGSFGLIWQLAADGEVKASLRACNRVDVAKIASHFGGGGHANAAGFRMARDRFMQLLDASPPAPVKQGI